MDYEWNFLVSWYEKYPAGRVPKAVHYTEGGPWFPDYRGTDYCDEWFAELRACAPAARTRSAAQPGCALRPRLARGWQVRGHAAGPPAAVPV